jgi:murein DD-endopeptidase MepM/ murein hydrolase activator NlpD
MRWDQFEPLKPRLLASVVLAGLVSACSSDAARFSDNPFQNPFTSRTSFDPASTASINRNVGPQAPRLQTAPVSTATTQPLPAPIQPIMRSGGPVATAPITAPTNTGSVAASAYPSLAPVAPRATTALGGNQGWTAVGGTPVTLQQGETLNTISGRYGVPVSALLAVNGLSSVNAAKPGQQIMIPTYNAVQGSAASAPRVASASSMLPSRETLSDAPKAIAPKAELPKAEALKASAPAPRASVRDVTQRVETDAEKRAAAKLKQLRDPDPAANVTRNAPKVASLDKAALEKSQAEKARIEAQRKADELKKAEADRKRDAAAKISATKKQVQDETTASIPEPKTVARAVQAPVEAPRPQAEEADTSSFRWPAQGKVINGFGGRSASGPNDGINISVPEGTPVRAAEGGTVIHADDALKGYGKLVLVRHANGLVTVYAHNSDIKVKRGENVRRGQVIAASGSSGNVTSPQLHFQIRKGAQALDPMKHLASN